MSDGSSEPALRQLLERARVLAKRLDADPAAPGLGQDVRDLVDALQPLAIAQQRGAEAPRHSLQVGPALKDRAVVVRHEHGQERQQARGIAPVVVVGVGELVREYAFERVARSPSLEELGVHRNPVAALAHERGKHVKVALEKDLARAQSADVDGDARKLGVGARLQLAREGAHLVVLGMREGRGRAGAEREGGREQRARRR